MKHLYLAVHITYSGANLCWRGEALEAEGTTRLQLHVNRRVYYLVPSLPGGREEDDAKVGKVGNSNTNGVPHTFILPAISGGNNTFVYVEPPNLILKTSTPA